MAKEGQGGPEAIAGLARRPGTEGTFPVRLWNPPDCGDIDMRIAADGVWFYQNTPIGRRGLVELSTGGLKPYLHGRRMFGIASGDAFSATAAADGLEGIE